MALLDRVKARTETDLSDGELTSLIAEAQKAIGARYGPDRDPVTPIEAEVDGGGRIIHLLRAIDPDEPLVVVEHDDGGFVSSTTETILAADDFRIRNGGLSLVRLNTGTNARYRWGNRAVLTYVPADDQPQRDEVVIKLVILDLQYEGIERSRVGDVTTDHSDYVRERERLLGSLSPRPGLLMA